MNKTLVIIYWNLGIGGIQKRIRDLVITIVSQRKGWNVIILTRRALDESFQEQFPSTDRLIIETYPYNNMRVRPIAGFFFWIFWRYIQIRPNSCLTFLPLLGVAMCTIKKLAFWTKTKLIINEGVILSEYLVTNRLEWVHGLVSMTYNHADVIIVPTLAGKEDLISSFSIRADHIEVISNWTLIKRSTYRPRPLYDIAYIGRFDKEKNVLIICDLIKEISLTIPSLRGVLIGSGDLLIELQKRIIHLGIQKNMQIMRFTPNAPTFMRRSKLLLLPSLSEGMPNVVLEAAMLQVPSVVLGFNGSHEVIRHGKTGYISDTYKELVFFTRKLLKDRKLREHMGKQAQEFVGSKFSHRSQREFIHTILS